MTVTVTGRGGYGGLLALAHMSRFWAIDMVNEKADGQKVFPGTAQLACRLGENLYFPKKPCRCGPVSLRHTQGVFPSVIDDLIAHSTWGR